MSRGSQRIKSSGQPCPWRIWVRIVEAQHRLRLPMELGSIIPWLREDRQSIDCLAMIGSHACLVVAPSGVPKGHAQAVERLRRQRFTFDEAVPQQIEYARYAATSWTVSLLRESSRYTITLPEDPRKLGIVPSTGQNAVVFALSEILEIWHADRWMAHVQSTAKNIESIRAAALENLSDDGDS